MLGSAVEGDRSYAEWEMDVTFKGGQRVKMMQVAARQANGPSTPETQSLNPRKTSTRGGLESRPDEQTTCLTLREGDTAAIGLSEGVRTRARSVVPIRVANLLEVSDTFCDGPPRVAHYCTCLEMAAVPSMPPSPMVSTADEGTITMEPFSLMASYSMFMARRWRAVGLLM